MTRIVSHCQLVVPEQMHETRIVSVYTLSDGRRWLARLVACCSALLPGRPARR